MNVSDALSFYLVPAFLALNYFSHGLRNSRGGKPLKSGTPLKAAIMFAVIASLMVLAGYYAAGTMEKFIDGTGEWVPFVMFMFVGFRLTLQGLRKKAGFRVFDIEQNSVIFAMSIALGINNLFAGVALRFMTFSYIGFSVLLAVMVLVMTFSGLMYGNQFREGFGRKMEIASGAGLMIMAIVVFLWS